MVTRRQRCSCGRYVTKNFSQLDRSRKCRLRFKIQTLCSSPWIRASYSAVFSEPVSATDRAGRPPHRLSRSASPGSARTSLSSTTASSDRLRDREAGYGGVSPSGSRYAQPVGLGPRSDGPSEGGRVQTLCVGVSADMALLSSGVVSTGVRRSRCSESGLVNVWARGRRGTTAPQARRGVAAGGSTAAPSTSRSGRCSVGGASDARGAGASDTR